MSVSVLNQVSLILANTVHRVSITVTDSTGTPIDPYALTLTVQDTSGNVKFTEVYPGPPTPIRLGHSATGIFFIDWGNQSINTETDRSKEWLFDWGIQLVNGGKVNHTLEKIKVISARSASLMPEFKTMIDKSVKIVDASNECYLGYSDAQLMGYLEGGVQSINAYQPSVTFSLDNFPLEYKQILLDAGLITGVMSQQLFAIDSDIPNYNDQGTSFVISHQPQLASFLNQITQRLDKLIPMMKLQLINSGAVYTQMGPNFRLQTLMEAAPGGSIFRNVFFVP